MIFSDLRNLLESHEWKELRLMHAYGSHGTHFLKNTEGVVHSKLKFYPAQLSVGGSGDISSP